MESIEAMTSTDSNHNIRKLCLLVLHTGSADLADCATPILHALTANAMDCEVEVYFVGRNVRLLVEAAPQSPANDRDPTTVSALLEDAYTNGIRIYACTSAWKANTLPGEILAPRCAGFAGAATYLGRALDPTWRVLSY